MLKNRLSKAVLACAMGAAVLGGTATADAAPAKYTHAQAHKLLTNAGFVIKSSGNCSDPKKSTCTSFQGINRDTVSGIIRFKRVSRCAKIRITAGTEVGHSTRGNYRHDNGYKLDISRSGEWACAGNYIRKHFTYTKKRDDGAAVYTSVNGNTYALEGDHWDITYRNGSA